MKFTKKEAISVAIHELLHNYYSQNSDDRVERNDLLLDVTRVLFQILEDLSKESE